MRNLFLAVVLASFAVVVHAEGEPQGLKRPEISLEFGVSSSHAPIGYAALRLEQKLPFGCTSCKFVVEYRKHAGDPKLENDTQEKQGTVKDSLNFAYRIPLL